MNLTVSSLLTGRATFVRMEKGPLSLMLLYLHPLPVGWHSASLHNFIHLSQCQVDKKIPQPPLGLPGVSVPGLWVNLPFCEKELSLDLAGLGQSWVTVQGRKPREALQGQEASWLEPGLSLR